VRPKALTSKQKDRHDRRSLKAWLKAVEVRGIEPLSPACKARELGKPQTTDTQERIWSEKHPKAICWIDKSTGTYAYSAGLNSARTSLAQSTVSLR
jgi:hypothetical protein